jgi:outer membrane protein assembly factor BamB
LVSDDQGRMRVLAVTPAGTLLERHTPGVRSDRWSRPHRVGKPGSWSPHAAPSAVSGTSGRTWVAAVTRHGALLTQHTTHDGHRWSGMHPVDRQAWSPTSTPALAAGTDGRVWLAAIGSHGNLVVRHTSSGGDRWQRPDELAGPWSTYASPALAIDRTGRAWVAAVTTDGDLTVSSQAAGVRRWQASRGLPHVPASETASPGLTSSVNGVLVGVTDRHGRVLWRKPVGPVELLPPVHGPHGGGFSVSRFL